MMHYYIVVTIILCIIGFQIHSFIDTKHKIKKYKRIFPSDVYSYSLKEIVISKDNEVSREESDSSALGAYEDRVSVSQIQIENASETLSKIEEALNKYLLKNKGAASDFHLMKDVVERYCDAEEEEISTQQPIPLYLGLMGTMVGIIVGVVFIAITHGFTGNDISNSVTQLMICVAIAMSASLFGIYCTTRISWKSKNAFSKVETDKNTLYSWIQTELLPTLSGNTVNALYLLQQNLITFNTTFQSNIGGLNKALEQVRNTSTEQIELINLIKDIDIRRVAQANITVLKELKECTGELSQFTGYIHNVSNYLAAVNALNNSINEHLNRTAAIEKMGVFFEKEINQVSAREQYINQVVANVDDTLKKTFESLNINTQKGISELQNSSIKEFDNVAQTMDALQQKFREQLQIQSEQFADALKSERESFLEYLRKQRESIAEKSSEITSIVNEIHNLADTKKSIDNLITIAKEQSTKIGSLANSLENGVRLNGCPHTEKTTIPLFYRIVFASIVALMVLSVGFNAYSAIKGQTPKNAAIKTEDFSNVNNELDTLYNSVKELQQ